LTKIIKNRPKNRKSDQNHYKKAKIRAKITQFCAKKVQFRARKVQICAKKEQLCARNIRFFSTF